MIVFIWEKIEIVRWTGEREIRRKDRNTEKGEKQREKIEIQKKQRNREKREK